MKKKDREVIIINSLRKKSPMTTTHLAEICNVSIMTIRRDLNTLQKKSLVSLFHGGATLSNENSGTETEDDYSLDLSKTRNLSAKKKIASKAASLINPQDILILDTGTTVELLTSQLPHQQEITVISYTLNAAAALKTRLDINLILIGGTVHKDILLCYSKDGPEMLKQHRANKVFIGATGVHKEMGVTSFYSIEQAFKQVAMENSEERILLVDSSKFGKISPSYVADISQFTTIISDAQIPEEYREFIENQSVNLITV